MFGTNTSSRFCADDQSRTVFIVWYTLLGVTRSCNLWTVSGKYFLKSSCSPPHSAIHIASLSWRFLYSLPAVQDTYPSECVLMTSWAQLSHGRYFCSALSPVPVQAALWSRCDHLCSQSEPFRFQPMLVLCASKAPGILRWALCALTLRSLVVHLTQKLLLWCVWVRYYLDYMM